MNGLAVALPGPHLLDHPNHVATLGDVASSVFVLHDTALVTLATQVLGGDGGSTGRPTFRECTSRCRVAAFGSQGSGTAERLEHAYDRNTRIVALDIPDREAILRVLEDCPTSWRSCGRRSARSTSRDNAKALLAGSVGGSARGGIDLRGPAAGGVCKVGVARAAVDIHREDGVRPPPTDLDETSIVCSAPPPSFADESSAKTSEAQAIRRC